MGRARVRENARDCGSAPFVHATPVAADVRRL
jgi:hypothetical protein